VRYRASPVPRAAYCTTTAPEAGRRRAPMTGRTHRGGRRSDDRPCRLSRHEGRSLAPQTPVPIRVGTSPGTWLGAARRVPSVTARSARARSWLFKGVAGVLVCSAVANLDVPVAAIGTPARDFASDSTHSFFTALHSPSATETDVGSMPARIVAETPADVYVVTNTVKPGGDSGIRIPVRGWYSSRPELPPSTMATTRAARRSGIRQGRASSTARQDTCT
jgi:hypothetical protein